MRINDQDYNRLRVLKTLRRAEPVARTRLAGLSGLTGSTITDIINRLISHHFILETKVSSPGPGRPRIDLCLNPRAAYVLGAYLRPDNSMVTEIVNLKGGREFSYSAHVTHPISLEDLADQLAKIVNEAIAASPIDRSDIHRIGVGLPAIVDGAAGIVYAMQYVGEGTCPVAAIMEERIGIPVTIDNETNVIARAEHWFGDSEELDNFSLIVLDLGLSAAHYVNGFLVYGAHGINPELSHCKIVPEGGRRCICGMDGCLTAYCSISGVVGQFFELQGKEAPYYLEMREAFRDMVKQAQAGNEQALEIFARTGKFLGIAMANQINARDPGRIVVMVGESGFRELIHDEFIRALHDNTLPTLRGLAPVEFKELSQETFWQGSAALVLEEVYKSLEPLPSPSLENA
jgi:predicted NBD/HSP70 family sugar kinase